jgi:hypothetical protein
MPVHGGVYWYSEEGVRLTCVLSAKAFSPHKTHCWILGSSGGDELEEWL